MKIGIIGAMEVEVDGLRQCMEQGRTERISGIDYHCGTICDCEVVVAQSGVGKVNAAICAQTMILRFQPDAVINSGVAGGHHSLQIGDIVVASAVVEHDMDTSPLGDPKGYISGLGLVQMPADASIARTLCAASEKLGHCKFGVIASGDQFISSRAQADRIHREFGAYAYEMEGAAIGHVCCRSGIPFGILRVISDNGDEQAVVDFPTFVGEAAAKSIKVIVDFLNHLD